MQKQEIKQEKMSTDVLIIGGGIAGLTAAISVKEENPDISVLVVEKQTSGYSGKANKGGGVLQYFDLEKTTPEMFNEYHANAVGGYLANQNLLKKYVAISSDVIFADKDRNREEIHKIWETCFGDEAELVDFYLDKRMTEDNMLLICQDGHAVSMASFLDINVRDGEEWKPAKYVYAVATLPEYRGRGYAGKILKKAEEIFNMPLVLVPAEKELVGYYRKVGFTEAYPSERLLEKQDVPELSAAELNSYSVEEITAAEYQKIREQKLMRDGFIAWDEAAIRFAMDFNCFCGGRTVKVVWSDDISRDESAEDADILMYCPENGTLHIIETTLGEEQFEELLPELMAQTKTERLVYDRKGIMVLSSDDQDRQERLLADGYFALSLA